MAENTNPRWPAEVLKKAQPHHFASAVERLLAGKTDHPFGPSTGYDLVLQDGTTLPPKAVFGLALTEALGRVVQPKHFSGGENSTCFRRRSACDLDRLGFDNGFPFDDRTWYPCFF